MVNPNAVAIEQLFTNEADAQAAAYDKQMEVHANGSTCNMDALKQAAGIIHALGGFEDISDASSGQLSYAEVGEKQQSHEQAFHHFV